MSKSIDEKTFSATKQQPPPRGDNNYHTHLELTSAKGAGTWLHATPTTNLGTQMDPMLSRTAILQWIRAPLAPNDTTCHLCSGVLDRYGDHCTLCPNGGDCTRRHNHLRNYTTTTPPVPASTQSSNDQAYFNPGLSWAVALKTAPTHLTPQPAALPMCTYHVGAVTYH